MSRLFQSLLSCIHPHCDYMETVSPPPVQKPHCPTCGGPVDVVTTPVDPPIKVGEPIPVVDPSAGFFGTVVPPTGNLRPPAVDVLNPVPRPDVRVFSDVELAQELARRNAAAQNVPNALPQVSNVAADDVAPLGKDSNPVDDGEPTSDPL